MESAKDETRLSNCASPTVYIPDSVPTPTSSKPLSLTNSTSHVDERFRRRAISGLLCFFAVGWGDAITGVVIPFIREEFHLGFTLASVLFLTGSAGYIGATFIIQPLNEYFARFSLNATNRISILRYTLNCSPKRGHSSSLGRCWNLLLFGILYCAFFAIIAATPTFSPVLVAFFIGGIGKSVLIAEINVFWYSSTRVPGLSVLHGVYGLGAFLSPLLFQILEIHHLRWQHFFYISSVMAIFNVALSVWAFHPTQKEFERDRDLSSIFSGLPSTTSDAQRIGDATQGETAKSPSNVMRKTLRISWLWWIAIVLCIYNGAETITGGFIVSYLLDQRNANTNTVAYVSSGFWGGLAAGRILIGSISPWFTLKVKSLYILVILVIGIILHIVIWQVNSYVVNAVFASLLGFLVGPSFPVILDVGTSILPPETHLTAMAICSSAGALGAAVFPFSVGAIANAKGVWVAEPVAIGILGFVFILWSVIIACPWEPITIA